MIFFSCDINVIFWGLSVCLSYREALHVNGGDICLLDVYHRCIWTSHSCAGSAIHNTPTSGLTHRLRVSGFYPSIYRTENRGLSVRLRSETSKVVFDVETFGLLETLQILQRAAWKQQNKDKQWWSWIQANAPESTHWLVYFTKSSWLTLGHQASNSGEQRTERLVRRSSMVAAQRQQDNSEKFKRKRRKE